MSVRVTSSETEEYFSFQAAEENTCCNTGCWGQAIEMERINDASSEILSYWKAFPVSKWSFVSKLQIHLVIDYAV